MFFWLGVVVVIYLLIGFVGAVIFCAGESVDRRDNDFYEMVPLIIAGWPLVLLEEADKVWDHVFAPLLRCIGRLVDGFASLFRSK
jgi:hypothetical protein